MGEGGALGKYTGKIKHSKIMTQGFNPYYILGSYFFFPSRLYDITKCSKLLNRIGNTGKTCKSYTVVGALAYMFVLPDKQIYGFK